MATRHLVPYELKMLPFRSLLLDSNNSRFLESSSGQIDALQKLLVDQKPIGGKHKIWVLAQDITYKKLVGDPFIVLQTNAGSLVTLDGNRRLAALKILDNPDIAAGFENGNLTKLVERFKKTLEKDEPEIYLDLLPIEVPCLVFKEENLLPALLMVKARHSGENEGAGQSVWSGIARQKIDSRIAGKVVGPELATLAFITKGVTPEQDLLLKEFYIEAGPTTITRIIQTTLCKEKLDFQLNHKDEIWFDPAKHSETEVREILGYLVEHFYLPKSDGSRRTVDDVRGQQKVNSFIDEFRELAIIRYPSFFKKGSEETEGEANEGNSDANDGGNSTNQNDGKGNSEGSGASSSGTEGTSGEANNNGQNSSSNNNGQHSQQGKQSNEGSANGKENNPKNTKPRKKAFILKWEVGLREDDKLIRCANELRDLDPHRTPLATAVLSRTFLELFRAYVMTSDQDFRKKYKEKHGANSIKNDRIGDVHIGEMIELLSEIHIKDKPKNAQNKEAIKGFSQDKDFKEMLNASYEVLNKTVHSLGYTIPMSHLLDFWSVCEPILLNAAALIESKNRIPN